MARCKVCGPGSSIEHDSVSGTSFCTTCGMVVSENAIVSEVSFGETSSGAAMVQGSYVGSGSSHARMSGPFGKHGSVESREQTIENARIKISQVGSAMKLNGLVQEQAQRYFGLALSTGFVKGRKSLYVICVCLYVACRFKQMTYMLIDFSDMLQVNVFSLGRTYLDFVRDLNIQRLPLIDPVHYIHRFATLLEFGDETSRVASDAVRLVQRFSRDWMHHGRRPSGICGAALLLAARMNNFRRSIQEIIQVVKIADTTIMKRLEEFKQTPSAKLTVQDFRTVTLEEEMDPPAYYAAKKREEKLAKKRQRDADTSEEEETVSKRKSSKKKRLKSVKDSDEDAEASDDDDVLRAANAVESSQGKALVLSAEFSSLVAQVDQNVNMTDPDLGALEKDPMFIAEEDTRLATLEIDPVLLAEDEQRAGISSLTLPQGTYVSLTERSPTIVPTLSAISDSIPTISSTPLFLPSNSPEPEPEAQLDFEAISLPRPMRPALNQDGDPNIAPHSADAIEESFDKLFEDEVNVLLAEDEAAAKLTEALDQADAQRTLGMVDELQGLDEAELDLFILTPEEVKLKERIWVEINREYLQNLASKMAIESGASLPRRKVRLSLKPPRKKGQNKPRDSTNPTGTSAADAARKLAAKKVSKKINYAAFDNLFARAPSERKNTPGRTRFIEGEDKTDEVGEDFMDDKDEDEDEDDEFGRNTNMMQRPSVDDDKEDNFGYVDDMYEQEI